MKRETEKLVVAAILTWAVTSEVDGLKLAVEQLRRDKEETGRTMKARQEKARANGTKVGRYPVDCPNGEYLAGKIEKGISVGTLARQYGVSRGTIGNRVREWKVAKNQATGQVEEEITLV